MKKRSQKSKRNPALYADPYHQALVDNFSKVQQSRMFSEITLAAHQGYDKSKIAGALAKEYRLNDRFAHWLVGHAVQRPLSNPKSSTNHKLIIKSLHDAMLECSQGDWSFVRTGSMTKKEAQKEFRTHLKHLKLVEKYYGNPMQKFPPVPKILQKVPQLLGDMTDAQWDDSVKWYSKLPLKEIRKRQDITAGQKEDLYRRTRAIGREMNAQESMGWNNLDVMESILTEAAMRKLPRYKGK